MKTSPTQANFGSTGGVPRSLNIGGAWRSNGSELEPPLSERSRGTKPDEMMTKTFYLQNSPLSVKSLSALPPITKSLK